VPVVASGGAGSARDVADVFIRGGADAALLAGVLHDGTTDIRDVKSALQAANIPVRAAA
jgi:cyclase